MEQLSSLVGLVKSLRREIFIALVAFIFFTIVIFPYGDLADLITQQVAKNTQNQVFLSFDDLGLGVLPPGVKLTEVNVDTAFMPQLEMASLSLAPSVAGFLAFKPGFVAKAEGLFGGDLGLTIKTGKKVDDEFNMQNIDLDISGMELKHIGKFVRLPVKFQGKGDIEFEGEIDPGFGEQPDTVYEVAIQKLRIPAGSVPTPLGPLNIPTVDFKVMNLKGRLVGGELLIDESQIGGEGDAIFGNLTGRLGLQFSRRGNAILPRFGSYNLNLDLSLNRRAEQDFSLFLGFLDQYRTVTGRGTRYALSLKGINFQTPPKLGPLRR